MNAKKGGKKLDVKNWRSNRRNKTKTKTVKEITGEKRQIKRTKWQKPPHFLNIKGGHFCPSILFPLFSPF